MYGGLPPGFGGSRSCCTFTLLQILTPFPQSSNFPLLIGYLWENLIGLLEDFIVWGRKAIIPQKVSLFLMKKRGKRNIRKLYKLKKGSECGGRFLTKCIFPEMQCERSGISLNDNRTLRQLPVGDLIQTPARRNLDNDSNQTWRLLLDNGEDVLFGP